MVARIASCAPRRGVAVVAAALALALAGCSEGDGPGPGPSTGSASGADGPAPSPVAWSPAPVWRGEVVLRHFDEVPVDLRLYPLQRVGGNVLLTVDYTPLGTPGQTVQIMRAFCPWVSCRSVSVGTNEMQPVSLVDTAALVRYEPLRSPTAGLAGTPVVHGSMSSDSTRTVGTTYRYGVFFPDPGTPTVSVDLVNAGAIRGVPIVDGGPTAPGLVADGPGDSSGGGSGGGSVSTSPTTVATPTTTETTSGTEPASTPTGPSVGTTSPSSGAADPGAGSTPPSPNPSVTTGDAGDGRPALVTLPVTRPGAEAVRVQHDLVAPVIGPTLTDYSGTVALNADVLFAFNSADLSGRAQQVIAEAVEVLTAKADPGKPLLVTGHTDTVGGTAFNDELSRRRAQAVATALQNGTAVAAWPMTVTGRGEREPVAPNTTPSGADDPDGRALNRRVVIAYTPRPEPLPSPSAGDDTSTASGGTPPSARPQPSPAVTLSGQDLAPNDAGTGLVDAQVDPVVVDGDLALVRFSVVASEPSTVVDSFAMQRASTDMGRVRLTDTATDTAYLAAHDADAEDSVLGSSNGFQLQPGKRYSFFVYTAAPAAGVTTVDVSLGGLGTSTVPVAR